MCVGLCECMDIMQDARAYGGQKRLSDPLEVETQVVVSCLMCVLGVEPESSEGAVHTLSCWSMSPAPPYFFEARSH